MADMDENSTDSGYNDQASSSDDSVDIAFVSYYVNENDIRKIHCDLCHEDDSSDDEFTEVLLHCHDDMHFRCLQCHAASFYPSELQPFLIHCDQCPMNA